MYFNLKTGQIFTPTSFETLKPFHLPLKEEFNRDCSKCNGKFHLGYNSSTKEYMLCPSCVKRFFEVSKYISEPKKNKD